MYLAEEADYSRYGASYRATRICEKIHIYSSQTGNEITDWYNGITY